MIPLTVVVLDVLRNRPPEMTFPERDHAMETLVLERAHEPVVSRRRKPWSAAVSRHRKATLQFGYGCPQPFGGISERFAPLRHDLKARLGEVMSHSMPQLCDPRKRTLASHCANSRFGSSGWIRTSNPPVNRTVLKIDP